MLEVFNNLFMSIAEQMGVSLQNTAYSVNIKERLDFSCAVFAADGTLVANAPHMPVHLGSMDRSVETIIRDNKGKIAPGDVYAINAPYNGGTHLPDITVCTPVFDDRKKKILFWVASRGHHADVGGISPGSMSPNATTIEQEGVYMDNFKLVDSGRFREQELMAALTQAKYPARNPVQNINDMKAQIAANAKGVAELHKMVAHFSMPVVQAYMQHVQDNAAESVRRVIDRLHDAEFAYEMDQGTVIKVKITVDRHKREATVDFTGTSPQQPTNFNAPEPVTRAAVLYVFRVMVDDDIPMNAGCLRPINIVIPAHSMLTPEYPAAVVAGNVETSQAITNCLFGALGALAAAQGTMNNLNFGNAKYQYYETICSGSPAGPGFPGTDAVHTHMTNTRLTDPEVLEFRYPVVLEDFHIRKGSGGKGQWNAGDGIRRTIRFLEKMECTILSGHRRVRPFGLAGGEAGQIGENWARRRLRPRERRETGEQDLFRSRLDQIIDMNHALVKLARTVDWGFLEERFGAVYTDEPGPAAAADAADGGAGDPQAHLRPLRRGAVRALGGEPLLPVLLRRGVLPAPAGVRSLVADALAPAHGRGEASGAAAGEPVGRHQDRGDQAVRAVTGDCRHHGAAQERDVPDRCQAAEPGARETGAAGQEARRGLAPVLCAGGQVRPDPSISAMPTPSSSSAPTGR